VRDLYLLLTPLLVLGVLGLVRFVGCELIYNVDELPQPLITDQVFGTTRNDYSGFAGMAIDVGSKPLVVRFLGRYCVAGSTGDHHVQIIDSISGTVVPGAEVVVSLAAKPEGFETKKLDPDVTLGAGRRYYVVSEEFDGGDRFFDNDTAVIAKPVASVVSPVFFDASISQWRLLGLTGHSYGPVQLYYVPD